MVLSWHDNVVTAAAVIMAWSGVVCRELTYAHASASSEWETSAGKQLEEYEEQEECDHCDGKQTTATIIFGTIQNLYTNFEEWQWWHHEA